MKLLFDQNLSHRLPGALAGLYPESSHVRVLGLERAHDDAIWTFAAAEGFAIVTKDDDFRQRSFLLGQPPKVIWVRLGNCMTSDVEMVLRTRNSDVLVFGDHPQAALLVLARGT